MSLVIGPTYTFENGLAETFGIVATVLDTPIIATVPAEALLGDPVVFEEDAAPHDIAVPIPHLPGLDEIELSEAGFSIASAPYERSQAIVSEALLLADQGEPQQALAILEEALRELDSTEVMRRRLHAEVPPTSLNWWT